jgi:DNA-binding SARP family transcriptional activator/tetratricopeptide (TPR) repeat protein
LVPGAHHHDGACSQNALNPISDPPVHHQKPRGGDAVPWRNSSEKPRAEAVRFRILGPLQVSEASGLVHLAPRPKALLARLLVDANHVVSTDRLIDDLWPDRPPRDGEGAVQNLVFRLRQAFAPSGAEEVLITRDPGYLVIAGVDDLDASRFEHLVVDARLAVAAGDGRVGGALLREGLGLWRGPALAEFTDLGFAALEAERLGELQRSATEDLHEAELELGRHGEIISELEAFVAANPLRERAWALLILGLYRAGRQAEALRAYQQLRGRLADELGIDPNPSLRALEQQILSQDPGLEWLAPEAAHPSGGFALALPPMAWRGHFVGRDDELEALQQSWKETTLGVLGVAVVAGEPGAGKTRLVSQFAQWASTHGAAVSYASCDEDLTVAYKPFLDILGSYVANAPIEVLTEHVASCGGELIRLVPALADRLPNVPAPISTEPESERYRLFEAVLRLLAAASSRQPLVMILENLHWADEATQTLTKWLLRTTNPMAVFLIATYRDTEGQDNPALDELLAEAARLDRTPCRLRLEGLDTEAVAELLADATGRDLDKRGVAFAASLQTMSAGNPFFVTELVAHFTELGVFEKDEEAPWPQVLDLDELGAPQGISEVITARVARLPGATRPALEAAAVHGGEFSVSVIEQVLAVHDDSVVDALDAASEAGLISHSRGQFAFAHALIRKAIEAGVAPARRARLHRRVGEALETEQDLPLEALAYHFAEAGTDGRITKAVDYALAAARWANNRLAHDAAIRILERAIAVLVASQGCESTRRGELYVRLSESRFAAGDVAGCRQAAQHAAHDAQVTESPHLMAEAALLAMEGHALGTPDPALLELLETALAGIGMETTAIRARLLAKIAHYRSRCEADSLAARPLARQALELARHVGDTDAIRSAISVLAESCMSSHETQERRTLAEQLFALAEQTGDLRCGLEACRIGAPVLLEDRDLAGFDSMLKEFSHLSKTLHSQLGLWTVACWRTMRALIDGRFGDAEKRMPDLFTFLSTGRDTPNMYAAQLFVLRREQGRLDELKPLLTETVSANPELASFSAALALTYAETSASGRAADLFESLAHNNFAAVPRDATFLTSLFLLSEVCAALRDEERASALYDMFLPYAGQLVVILLGVACPGAADRFLGMLAATRQDWATAEHHYRAALTTETLLGCTPLLVRTRLWYARLLGTRGASNDRGRAEELLGMATVDARRLGMTRIVREAAGLLEAELPPV